MLCGSACVPLLFRPTHRFDSKLSRNNRSVYVTRTDTTCQVRGQINLNPSLTPRTPDRARAKTSPDYRTIGHRDGCRAAMPGKPAGNVMRPLSHEAIAMK